jgi:hypothetical protein
VLDAIATRYEPSSRSSNANVPSASVVPSATVAPDSSRTSTVTPGRPSSSDSTTPVSPPPGLKSRHTTPVIPPWSGSGRIACTASSGTSEALIAVRPRSATPPDATGSARTNPLSDVPSRPSVEARASVKAPDALTASFATPTAALTAPWFGSFSYITRQMTPAAKREIAIGMNTTVLNATEKRTFSVSTANTSPIAVTKAGTTMTQSALFLSAVTSVSSLTMAR